MSPDNLVARCLSAYAEAIGATTVVGLFGATTSYARAFQRAKWPIDVQSAPLVSPVLRGRGGGLSKVPRAIGALWRLHRQGRYLRTGEGQKAPRFREAFLPGALWLIGLGNLGQAYLWALSGLPFADPGSVSLVLQDKDTVSEENWATSVLVKAETYGALKTKVAEDWASAKGFRVRRIDRWLTARDRVEDDDPRLALSGVDKVNARKLMAKVLSP